MAEEDNAISNETLNPFRSIPISSEPVNAKCDECPCKDLSGAQCVNSGVPFCALHPDNLDPDSPIATGLRDYERSMQQALKHDAEVAGALKLALKGV